MSQNETAKLLSEKMLSAAEGVLGSMLIDEKAVGPMLQAVTEEDFLKPEYRSVFRAIRELYGQGKPCDPILLNEYLGGDYGPLLVSLMELTPTSANVGAYAQALRESSRLWRLRGIGSQLNEAVELDACRELVDKANLLLSERSGVRRLDMERGFTEFFKRHSQSRPPDHLRLGLGRLDELVQMRPGDMVVIGGYASAGKTAFALQLAFQIAKAKRVGFFSLETGEVSEVVETEAGYEIIKCLSTFDREQTDLNKLTIVEERRREVFGQEYDAFVETLARQLNEKVWEEMALLHDEELETTGFFDVYAKYFPD